MAVIPEKFYVTRVYRSAEEMLGWMVVADNEETKKFKQSKEKADRWATPYHNSTQKAMEPIYVDNEPRTGFRMVTNVSRYSTSNVVWRIMHPEGFEFEITSDNLCDLLETNTIIEGEFQDALFFTHNKKLVNEKTKLFADLIAREEHKKEQQKNAKEVEVGDILTIPLEQTTYNNTPQGPDSLTVVYCGKYHAINVSKNDRSEFTTKSSLKFVVKNVDDNRYYALSKLPDFSIGRNVEVDRATVISEMNEQIRNTHEYTGTAYYYFNHVPNALAIMFLNEKPYKLEDVHMEYHEVPFSTVNYFEHNKIYRIGNTKLTSFRLSYSQQTYSGPRTSESHSSHRDPNNTYFNYSNTTSYTLIGVTGVQITAYGENGAPSELIVNRYSSYNGNNYTNLTIPQTIEVGYYTL